MRRGPVIVLGFEGVQYSSPRWRRWLESGHSGVSWPSEDCFTETLGVPCRRARRRKEPKPAGQSRQRG